MKRWFSFSVFFVLIVLLLEGCQAGGLPIVTDKKSTPTVVVTPLPGKAVVKGRVLNLKGEPIANTPVRLAQVYRQGDQGAFALDLARSPSSISTQDGYFTILEAAPAEYLIVIGNPDANNYVIYQRDKNKEETISPQADSTLDVGVLTVDYTP